MTLLEYFAADERLRAWWDGAANAPLDPARLKKGSKTLAWWKCERGHRWQARIDSMTGGCGGGCPYCSGRRAIPGESDLATLHPRLMAEWDREKNGALDPTSLRPGSRTVVWWKCPEGHSWQASVNARTKPRGAGCPVCSGAQVLPGVNDLASLRPDLAAQWDGEKNGALRPDQVTVSSSRAVWWKCSKGHSWQALVSARTRSKRAACPGCAGGKALPGVNDLATLRPELAAQWHPTLNGALRPDQVTASSNRRVWWRCGEGHVWQAQIYGRAKAKDPSCPACAGGARARGTCYFQVRTAQRPEPVETVKIRSRTSAP